MGIVHVPLVPSFENLSLYFYQSRKRKVWKNPQLIEKRKPAKRSAGAERQVAAACAGSRGQPPSRAPGQRREGPLPTGEAAAELQYAMKWHVGSLLLYFISLLKAGRDKKIK